MTPESVALTGVVLGAVLGGVAQIVAGVLQAKRSREERRYLERRDAYVQLLRAVRDQAHAVANLSEAVGKRREMEFVQHRKDAVRETVRALRHAETELEVFGSTAMVKLTKEQTETFNGPLSVALEQPMNYQVTDLFKANMAMRKAEAKLVEAAKAELGSKRARP